MTYSVYARDQKNGREYALPQRYFGNLPTRDDAEIALAWYLQNASAVARERVEAFIIEHRSVTEEPEAGETRELVAV